MQDRRPLAVPSRVGHDGQTHHGLKDSVLSLGFDAFVFDFKELEGGTERGFGDNQI